MAGERTPDTTPQPRQGSSDDDISLREHMQRQIDTTTRNLDGKIADLSDLVDTKISALARLLDERYAAQTKAIDTLAAATDKRFDGVNEFRAQQRDMITTFMPRSESISRHDRTSEAIAALAQRHEADIAAVNKRLDLNQGASSGLDKAWGYIIGAVGLAGGLIAIVLSIR